jgi:hypothetical protein
LIRRLDFLVLEKLDHDSPSLCPPRSALGWAKRRPSMPGVGPSAASIGGEI